MQISIKDVEHFAAWSGDRNPLHVDAEFARRTHFGRPVVHGMFAALRAVASAAATGDMPSTTLDIEFRHGVFAGQDYQVERAVSGNEQTVTLAGGGIDLLTVRGSSALYLPSDADFSWAQASSDHNGVRTEAVARSLDELDGGIEFVGVYDLASASLIDGVPPTHARVLALCSYVTGMEVPGLKSLFTSASIRFWPDVEAGERVRYRVRTVRFDRQFRVLETELQVATESGQPVAGAVLRSYVPFSPAELNLHLLEQGLADTTASLRDKVALVIGGSQGLGAEIAAALALAGARVYITARHDDSARHKLQSALTVHGRDVRFIQGDASDSAWCKSTVETVRAEHGRLDIAVLCACAPPVALPLGADSLEDSHRYITDNLRLVQTPLAAVASPLRDSHGALVYLSSSFVDELPAGFGPYVAVKQAGEALVRTVAHEMPEVHALIARPPVLQTRWNDTPAGVVKAIPAAQAAVHIVNRLAARSAGARVDLVTHFPPVQSVESVHRTSVRQLSIRLAATFTADPLLASLEFWAKELNIDAAIDAAPYGQVLQALLDPGSLLNAPGRGANVVMIRVRDWLRDLTPEQTESIEFIRTHLRQAAHDLEGALRAHRARASCDTLLLLCPSYEARSAAEGIVVRQTEIDVANAVKTLPGLRVVLATDFHALYGVNEDEAADTLRDEIAHIPYRDEYLNVLATIAVRHVHRSLSPLRKVVVVDCDNTLWRGVVGEVGPDGVEIDDSHRALHSTLARLAHAGTLVCLCSKNEESDVWPVFERPDVLLTRGLIVDAAINWQPKSRNLQTLANRLNLGLDSFIFIDDSPVECAEVRASCPEVLTIEWPQETDSALKLMDHLWELDAAPVTKEDERRTAMYREELTRQQLQASAPSFVEFINGLRLVVDVAPLALEDLRRAAQLTLRTNQFNFTTIRRDEGELQALVAKGGHEIRTVRVRDRFGDYGLVGLVILERGATWLLDTFLLSCRVLGRGVEHQVAAAIGTAAAEGGAEAVRVRFTPSSRNAPARAFLESIVPSERRRISGDSIEADVSAAWLSSIRFDPAASTIIVRADDDGERPGPSAPGECPRKMTPDPIYRVRRREQQILRTAFELADVLQLRAAIEGANASGSPTGRPLAFPAGADDVVGTVYAAFADALRIPVERVKETDLLEALGCDSLRIVQITVALRQKFPSLPATLLFEHRSVRDIANAIVALRPGQPSQREPSVAVQTAVVHRDRHTEPESDIAVVGMHVRCAGAGSPEELWDLLSRGESSVGPVPPTRRHFLSPLADSRPHWAGLLDDAARFDAEFFGIAPREAELMDPQLRLFLEVAWGALEDAGCLGADHDTNTGVFAGVMYGDYTFRANLASKSTATPYRSWEGFSLANRLSQLLGFQGPSLAVDTACSSSGTALHLACSALKQQECRIAVVGGVNLILDSDRFGALGRLGILSPRGRCEPFGEKADGTVLGEGAGVVVLRLLRDALRRGDRIYGVIKGTGISTGSGTVGFTAPNPQAQAEAIRRALRAANIDARTVSYVETHGTGTALGDPIEVRGLMLGYGSRELYDTGIDLVHRCTIGSIKPNIGHLEAGAGVLGLVKVLLQLERGFLAPSMTSARPNPQIPFGDGPFDVQRRLEPWRGPQRRAAVSSFGVGGANAHVIVEESPPAGRDRLLTECDRPIHLLALSARTPEALRERAADLMHFLETHPDADVADVCFSVNAGRKHFEHRAAVCAQTRQELVTRLNAVSEGREQQGIVRGQVAASRAKTAFLFTGQGSQYAGMGRELYQTQPVFRAALDRCARVLDDTLGHPLVDLLFATEGGPDADVLDQTGVTQPALFALEYALGDLWLSWGVRPDVVLGHSVGEISAMCVAGGLSLSEGAALIAARGRLMQALPPGGTMTSVMADEALVRAAINGSEEVIAIAAVNAPAHVVISGVGAAVDEVTARLSADGIRTKALTVSHAFHSPLMKPMLAEYERAVRKTTFSVPVIPVVSCIEPEATAETLTHPEYWIRQVLEPVRFASGMRALERLQIGAYIEIGPQPVLLGMGRQCVGKDEGAQWLSSLRRNAGEWQTILDSVARLYVHGAEIDWRGFDAPYSRQRLTIPAYPFARKQYWLKHVPAVAAPADSASTANEAHVRIDSARAPAPAVYETVWREQPRPAGVTGTERKQWIVCLDGSGVGEKLATTLAASGAAVETIAPGARADAVVRRLRSGLGSDRANTKLGVACLWSLDAGNSEDVTADLERATRSLVDSVHLVQTLAQPGTAQATLWFVTRGAVAAVEGSPVSIAQSLVWGAGRTIALEHPEIWGGLVDIGSAADVPQLAAELTNDGFEDQVVLRDERRFVARLARREMSALAASVLRADGTYLITGGLGAIGLRLARHLVEQGARHLTLVNRRAAMTPRQRADIEALERLGAHVAIAAADVSDAEAIGSLLERIAASRFPLRGVFHLAGVDSVVPVQRLSEAEIRSVLTPKVAGAWLLHEHTRTLDLDLFVCFSSISSVLGSHGRAHYGAANAFLDALAAERRRLGLHALSVNWGPWNGGGMATAAQLEELARIGHHGLEPHTALEMLDRLIGNRVTHASLIDIDWNAFAPAYAARRRRPILAELETRPASQPTEATASPWMQRLLTIEPTQRHAVLADLLRRELVDMLGFENPSSVPDGRQLSDIGMDSLMTAELIGRLRKLTGKSCSAVVLDRPTVTTLAAGLLEELGLDKSEAHVARPAADNAAYSGAAESEIFEFHATAWPHRNQALIPARWRWMHVESAHRLGREPGVWLQRDSGRIVGHMASIPARLKLDAGEIDSGWLVDTMVLPSHRDRAVGSRLMMEAHRDQPISLSLGQTAEMREICLRLGWKQIAPLQIAQLLVRPETVLKGKLPAPAAWAAAAGVRSASTLRDLFAARAHLQTREVERFSERHDQLWVRASRDLTCAVVRDASYLNWKYVDQPGQRFLRLDISDRGVLQGVAVWMFREPDEHYRYTRAFLVDMIAPLANAELLRRVLRSACAEAVKHGPDALLCLHINACVTGALRACGFRLRKPERYLLVDPGPLAGESLSTLLNETSWFVTHGDSDIDRPW